LVLTSNPLSLGLGTGVASTLIVDGIVKPMELGHLPYEKGTYESYVGNHSLLKKGKKKRRRRVADAVDRLVAALEPDEVVLGGGNAKELKELPPKCRVGDNSNAFRGGFRLWEEASAQPSSPRTGSIPNKQSTGKDNGNGNTRRSDQQAPSGQTAGVEGPRRSL
jgi:polyphosphate glucokinase